MTRTHPRPMLLVLAVRWIAVVWLAIFAGGASWRFRKDTARV